MSKITKAIAWGVVGQASRICLKFGVTIYLARLLSPNEFGLLAKVTIILAILNTVGNFGLSASLIQKKDTSLNDYSTVFWANLLFGVLLSALLFVCAPLIAAFYNTSQLAQIARVLSITILINQSTIVHQAILTKQLDVKRLEIYSFVSSLFSAAIGLYLAYSGRGIWSLVAQQLSTTIFLCVLFWIFEPFRPIFVFDRASFRRLSGYGSNMAFSNLLDMLLSNLDSILIGRYFSTSVMGFYTYSQSLTKTILTVSVGPIYKVLFPTLAKFQDDNEKLKETYKRFVGTVNFIVLPVMGFIIVMAEEIVEILLDEKWSGLSQYLRFFAFISIIYNHCAININIISAKGRGRLFLRLEVVKKVIMCGCLAIGFQFGISGILIGVLIYWLTTLAVDIYFSGKVSEYTWSNQIYDLLPNIVLAFAYNLALIIFKFYLFDKIESIWQLGFVGILGLSIYLSTAYLFKLNTLNLSIGIFKGLKRYV